MWKTRVLALLILIAGCGVGYFVYRTEPVLSNTPVEETKFPFKLGLDLSGGTHLVYRADVSAVAPSEVSEAMDSLRDVVERRVNLFGVSEPVVQVESGGFSNNGEERLTIDIPGVTDVNKAITMIGQTPLLEFKTERPEGPEKDALVAQYEEAQALLLEGKTPDVAFADPFYIPTDLTGRFLSRAAVEFSPNTREPIVSLTFNTEGAELFKSITSENVGKTVAIYLDGAPISAPVVREAITTGSAQISGNFTPEEAKTLVGRLNSGALPVPIELVSTQTIGASLGVAAVHDGIRAAIIGFLAVALFLIVWYRLPGIIGIITLALYALITLSLFKLFGVTLTAGGIAGFIISIGVAVDANVLVFERIKEEIRNGRTVSDGIRTGFSRTWFAIRDSNFSGIITALILFAFGTSIIKGFALTFGLGILVSMFTAITISRIFMLSLGMDKSNRLIAFLFGSGLSSAKAKK
ncbi:MAG: protein translocase subunit SecD [Candidatus Pacebacteria bacterium]|jgi:protein-export membrane protein SecD|nr:protein translocase subunit SecD [Candidatus Paceibacterota bacterium]